MCTISRSLPSQGVGTVSGRVRRGSCFRTHLQSAIVMETNKSRTAIFYLSPAHSMESIPFHVRLILSRYTVRDARQIAGTNSPTGDTADCKPELGDAEQRKPTGRLGRSGGYLERMRVHDRRERSGDAVYLTACRWRSRVPPATGGGY